MADEADKPGRLPPLKYPRLSRPPHRLAGRYYSTEEAAELLGVSKQRVTVFIAEGRLTGHMLGRVWLIAACSVERLAELKARGEMLTAMDEIDPDGEEVTG